MTIRSEVLRRAIQLIISSAIFDAPFLLFIRLWGYRLFGTVGKGTVIARSVMFIRPHGLQPGFLEIGENVGINHHAELDYSGRLVIEGDVWISQGVIVETHEHFIRDRSRKKEQPIGLGNLTICRDAWVGANCVILPSVRRIGEGALIGAGAVVTRDVEDWAIVAGVPARVIGTREDRPR